MKTSSTTSLWSWALLACLWILSVTVTATEGDYLRPQPPHSRQLQSPSRIVNSKDFKTCQEAVFNHIASCTNNNFMFVTTLGDANTSFSTEFLYYYVRTIWLTFFSNRRMIFLRTKRHWQYDCPEQLGWFCYFTKHSYCPDTVTEVKDMDISHPRNSRDKWGVPGPKMIDRNQIADIYYHPSGQTIAFHMLLGVYKPMFNNLTMSYFNQTSLMTSQVGACSIQKDDWIQFHDIIGMMVKYAFQLNPHTLLKVNQINKVYASLWKTSSTRFASLCLRSQDEFAQHGNNNLQREDQLILFNSSLVVKHFLTSLQNHTVSNRGKQLSPIQDVYISSDNCSMVVGVYQLLKEQGYKVTGPCIQVIDKKIVIQEPKAYIGMEEAHHILADLVMLQRSHVYVTTLTSQWSRIAHYLRYPHYENTFSLFPRLIPTLTDSLNEWKFYF